MQRRKKVEVSSYYSYFASSPSLECIGTPFIVSIPSGCTYSQLRWRLCQHLRYVCRESESDRALQDGASMAIDTPGSAAPPTYPDHMMDKAFTIAWHQSRYTYSLTDAGERVRDDEGVMALENMGTLSVDWAEDAIAKVRVQEEEERVDIHPTCNSGVFV